MNLRVRAGTPKVLVQMENVVLLPMFLESDETLDLLTTTLNIILAPDFLLSPSSTCIVWRGKLDRYRSPFFLASAVFRIRTMSTAKYSAKAAFS
jgi:hypothetical protein